MLLHTHNKPKQPLIQQRVKHAGLIDNCEILTFYTLYLK